MNLTLSFCLLALYHMHFLFAIYSIYFFESSQTFGYCSHITIPRGVLAWICHNPFYEIVDRSEAVLSSPPWLLHLRGVSYSLVHGLCTCCAVYSIVNVLMKEENLSFLLTLTKKAKKQAHQMKFYQKYFTSCFNPRRILSRTRLGSTPSTSAISFTVIPK